MSMILAILYPTFEYQTQAHTHTVLSSATQISGTMISLTKLVLALSVISGALAAPTEPLTADDSPDFEVGGTNLARRQDYTQNYKTGGNVNFQSTNNGYSVSFSGAQDFVVGRGWRTGTSR
jgi:endo-1,4-beta-xylanase